MTSYHDTSMISYSARFQMVHYYFAYYSSFAYCCLYMQTNMQNMQNNMQTPKINMQNMQNNMQTPKTICRIVHCPYSAYLTYICTPHFANVLNNVLLTCNGWTVPRALSA